MPDTQLSDDEKRRRIAQADADIKKLQEFKEGLGAKEPGGSNGGGGGGGELSARVKAEDENAALFDRLSPGELTNLYLNDRPRWEAIMEAKEKAGMERLLRRRTP